MYMNTRNASIYQTLQQNRNISTIVECWNAYLFVHSVLLVTVTSKFNGDPAIVCHFPSRRCYLFRQF